MSADEAALLRSMVALVRQRYGLDEIEAAAYVVDMPSRIKALEAENAALRDEVSVLREVIDQKDAFLRLAGCKS